MHDSHTDAFDTLIEQSLQAQAAGKHPPRRVWRRIRAAISAESPRLPRWRWSMAAQVVVAMLVLLGSQQMLANQQRTFAPPTVIFTPNAEAVTQPALGSEALVVNPEREHLRALKLAQQPEVQQVVSTPPINLPPTDVVRPATELYEYEPSAPVVPDLSPQSLSGGLLR